MRNIVYSRIDDRLIHGQVMTAWVQFTQATEVVIVDDDVAKDEFTQIVMRSAMPSKIALKIFNINQAIAYLNEDESKNENIFILAKTPMVFLSLIEEGINIKSVGIGGMGARSDRNIFFQNISASDLERQTLESMLSIGVDVFIQIVPDKDRIEVKSIINK